MYLKLADFGSAKFYNSNIDNCNIRNDEGKQSGGSQEKRKGLVRMNTFLGTIEYMAPEIISRTCVKNE